MYDDGHGPVRCDNCGARFNEIPAFCSNCGEAIKSRMDPNLTGRVGVEIKKRYFNVGDTIGIGWTEAKRSLGVLIAAFIIPALINIAFDQAPNLFNRGRIDQELFIIALVGFSIVGTVIEWALTMGYIRIALNVHDKRDTGLGDLFSCLHLLLKYFVFVLVGGLAIVVGFILLIVPGIYLSIKFFFAAYFIVDMECGGIEALRRSWKLTEHVWWKIFGFVLLMFLINAAGAMMCLVGLLFTVPISAMATAYVYRRLLDYQARYEPEPWQEETDDEGYGHVTYVDDERGMPGRNYGYGAEKVSGEDGVEEPGGAYHGAGRDDDPTDRESGYGYSDSYDEDTGD